MTEMAGFGPNGSATEPSNWLRNTNWSDQSILGATSTLKPTLVNDFRFSYAFWSNRNLFPTPSDCGGCVGLDGPQITYYGAGQQCGAGRHFERDAGTRSAALHLAG